MEYINKKNGKTYEVLDRTVINANNGAEGRSKMVLYQNEEGQKFVRDELEFRIKFKEKLANRPLRVLVACEESQAVTKEFRKLGHEAYSCDILPCSGGHPEWHLQQDVFKAIDEGNWDMMIGFPPCTDLAVSGARHFARKRADGSQQKSIDFFMKLANAPIDYIMLENPVGIMSTEWRKPNQIIQPWQHGDKAQKSTCLWTKGLPKIVPTDIVEKGEFFEFTSKKGEKKRMPMWYYKALQDAKTPAERSLLRSKTFRGIAKAIATQYSEFILNGMSTEEWELKNK